MKLRNILILSGIFLLIAAGIAVRFIMSYHYSHMPFRSAIIPRPITQAGQAVDGLAFSPDGKTLAVADTQTGISVWDVPQLRCRRRVEHQLGDGVSTPVWLPNTSTLTLADSMRIRRWNMRQDTLAELPAKQVRFRRTIPKTEYWDVFQIHVVSPSGKLAAGADADGDVVVWNVNTGRRLFAIDAAAPGKFGYAMDFCDIAFSPDDRFVALSSMTGDNSVGMAPLDITIRDTQTGHAIRHWQWKEAYLMKVADSSGGNLGNTGLVFSPDGSAIAAADMGHVAIWETKTGKLRQTLSQIGISVLSSKRLVFFQNGHLLAGCGWGNFVPVWSVDTGKLLQTFYADSFTQAVAVSPDNKLLATGGQTANGNGRIELWDISRLLR
jgi:WD40 repeat protein